MLIFDILKTFVSSIIFLILRAFAEENIEKYWKSYLIKSPFTLSIFESVFPIQCSFEELILFVVSKVDSLKNAIY